MDEFAATGLEAGRVLIERDGVMGVITLDRPEAVNALTTPMIRTIADALAAWSKDDRVGAVLIEGRGARGFSAGGDIRAARAGVLAGLGEAVKAFFAAEYALNLQIATYPKPVVALQHGAVMGGGVGLSSHAAFRAASHSARFCMPENTIGFFADVGVNALLARAPEGRALAFLLSGATVGVADALALGLTDASIADHDMGDVRRRVIEAAGADAVDTAIGAVLSGFSTHAGEAEFTALAESLSDCFAQPDIEGIVAYLDIAAEDGDVGAASLLAAIRGHCPTSVAVNLAAHRKARRDRNLAVTLDTDLRLAEAMCMRADFLEGVRTRLIDREDVPGWSPARLSAVDHAEIARWLG